AKRWNVPLTCNEFGVYRRDSDPQDRARWIHDVRTTLEHYGIGWNMWDFGARDDGKGFGVVNGPKEGPNTADEAKEEAVGLKGERFARGERKVQHGHRKNLGSQCRIALGRFWYFFSKVLLGS